MWRTGRLLQTCFSEDPRAPGVQHRLLRPDRLVHVGSASGSRTRRSSGGYQFVIRPDFLWGRANLYCSRKGLSGAQIRRCCAQAASRRCVSL